MNLTLFQIAILTSLLLSLIFISYGVGSALPHVSYMKALDIFIFACISFISVALLEIGIAYFVPQSNGKCNGCLIKMAPKKDIDEKYQNNGDGSEKSADIDSIPKLHYISRFVFPGAYFIFLAGYWIYYMS